jgi:hypothetical protein
VVPQPRQIIGERQQGRALIIGESSRLIVAVASDLVLDPRDHHETFIPATFKLAGHQSVVRVHRVILPARPRRLIAGLLQSELALPQLFRTGSLAIRDHLERRLESQRRDHAQDFRRHGRVDAHIAESDALFLGA